jgi:hypothetical protein
MSNVDIECALAFKLFVLPSAAILYEVSVVVFKISDFLIPG